MIDTMIFDLDGTLVKTERLKAISYAKAAVELCPHNITEDEIIDAFKDVVGLSRQEVATNLVERFELQAKAEQKMDEFNVQTAWQSFVQVRLKFYDEMLSDPEVLRNNQWEHNIAVLHQAREHGCKTALATMSHCPQVNRVLDILDLKGQFDFVATRDDVEHGKPNPEIYNLVAAQLQSEPQNTLVLEDSPSGVQAALNANMNVIAVSTPFTHDGLHALDDIDSQWIVDDPNQLSAIIDQAFKQYA